jgi:S1-C subfamily serine protease
MTAARQPLLLQLCNQEDGRGDRTFGCLLAGGHVGGRRPQPRVAALEVSPRRSDGRFAAGAGSGVVFTNDGFLLTNAHVVEDADTGRAAFSDGTVVPFHVVGTDPLSDLAVVRADGPTPELARAARRRTCGWGSWWWRSATRWAWPAALPRAWSAR